MRDSDVKNEIDRMTKNLMAGGNIMAGDGGYELSTHEKQAEFAAKRCDQNTINKYLFAMLGSAEMVEKWWVSPNKNWNGDTPLAVYDRGGQEEVMAYVQMCSEGGW